MQEKQIIYESAIVDFRQLLSDTQWELAQAKGWLKVKNQRIDALERELEAARALSGPKPGPPPAH